MENIDIESIINIVTGLAFLTAHLIAIFGIPRNMPKVLIDVIQALAANYKFARNANFDKLKDRIKEKEDDRNALDEKEDQGSSTK